MEKLRIAGYDITVGEVTEIEPGVVDYVVLFHFPESTHRVGIVIDSFPEDEEEGRPWRSSDGDKGRVELIPEGYVATIYGGIAKTECSSIGAIVHAIIAYR